MQNHQASLQYVYMSAVRSWYSIVSSLKVLCKNVTTPVNIAMRMMHTC